MRLTLCLITVWTALGQPSASFEVATIKPAAPNQPGYGSTISQNVLTLTNYTLHLAIEYAYGLHEYQLSGGPKWSGTETFDITGKAGQPPASAQEMRRMLQALLAERFQLELRKEMRPLPAFALTAAKGGVKMERVAEPTGAADSAVPVFRSASGVLSPEDRPFPLLTAFIYHDS